MKPCQSEAILGFESIENRLPKGSWSKDPLDGVWTKCFNAMSSI